MLRVEGFAGEVVKAVGESGEHQDGDPVVVEGVLRGELEDLLVGCGFVELDADAEQADDAAGGDEARGVERAGRDLGFSVEGRCDRGRDRKPVSRIEMLRVGGVKAGVTRVKGFAVGAPEIERGLVEGGGCPGVVVEHGAVDHPAHQASDKDRQRGCN